MSVLTDEPATTDTSRVVETDVLITGAGPSGLYGAYYAGFRGLRVAVMDVLPQQGGQISAMYPEKPIFDIAGFPSVRGRDLVESLVAQAAPYDPRYLLGERAVDLAHASDGRPVVRGGQGTTVRAGAVVITGGVGTFTPRPLPAGEDFLGRGQVYFVPDASAHAGHDVVVVGGDSAFDWAAMLAPVARSVTLVHRTARFRAHRASVDKIRALGFEIVTDSEVSALHGTARLEGLEVRHRVTKDARK
ncbi:NAD(P)/FAD-dependent oxidoreductase [Streptomyces sp. NBC_00443]|uniref:NAD(P)/FAD-dependent oxidoreductase n=1 Tax=Streptomyces sp. NBC_00443 TaxID=2975743 RepID=UPI002E2393A9